MTSLRISALALALGLAACSGSGGLGGILGGGGLNQCQTGTAVQIARPSPSQTGVDPATNGIEIVASGNGNTLGSTYTQWNLVLQDSFGDPVITTGPLSLASDPGGPHPYASDYYYSAPLQSSLRAGVTYNVFITQTGASCTNAPVAGTFST